MINIAFIEKGEYRHEDMEIRVGGMSQTIVADTYFYYDNLTNKSELNFKIHFKELLYRILNSVKELDVNQLINIPIALYDEYTDFISIKLFNNTGMCNIYYSSAFICGYELNPWNDINYNLDKDLVYAYQGGIFCDIDDIVKGLNESIEKL